MQNRKTANQVRLSIDEIDAILRGLGALPRLGFEVPPGLTDKLIWAQARMYEKKKGSK